MFSIGTEVITLSNFQWMNKTLCQTNIKELPLSLLVIINIIIWHGGYSYEWVRYKLTKETIELLSLIK